MPSSPSPPRLPKRQDPPPRPSSIALESIRERERLSMGKRKGFMSTMATRPSGLGQLNIEKQKVLGA